MINKVFQKVKNKNGDTIPKLFNLVKSKRKK